MGKPPSKGSPEVESRPLCGSNAPVRATADGYFMCKSVTSARKGQVVLKPAYRYLIEWALSPNTTCRLSLKTAPLRSVVGGGHCLRLSPRLRPRQSPMFFAQYLEPCPALPLRNDPPPPVRAVGAIALSQSNGTCCFRQILGPRCCFCKAGGRGSHGPTTPFFPPPPTGPIRTGRTRS